MLASIDVLRNRIKWLMFLRVVVATFLLGGTILLQLREARSLWATELVYFYRLIGLTYAFSLLYVFLLKRES